MLERKSSVGCSLLPLAPASEEINTQIEDVCAGWLPNERWCKRLVEHLFCGVELLLCDKNVGEALPFGYRRRSFTLLRFAPDGQCLTVHLLRFREFPFGFQRQAQPVQRIQCLGSGSFSLTPRLPLPAKSYSHQHETNDEKNPDHANAAEQEFVSRDQFLQP